MYMTAKSRVPLNAALLSASQLARTAVGFLFFLFLARRLGPDVYGKYMFAFALSEIFSILGDLGLHEYTIRELARRPERLKERWVGIIALKTVLAGFSALIMVALLPLLGKDSATNWAIVAFALAQIGYSWFYASTIAFSVWQDLHLQALLWLLEKIAFAAAGAAALLLGRSFVAVALSNTLVQFAGGIAAVWIVVRKYGPLSRSLHRGQWRPYLKAALPFGLIVGFYLVYFRIDSVMISFFRSDEEVGLYGAAYNLVSAMLFLPAGLIGALYPHLAGSYSSPSDNLDGPFQKASRWLLAMSLPMAVGIWLLSGQLVPLLLGADYGETATALAILGWTLPVWFITFLEGNLLTIIERQKAVAAVGLINMVANLGLNLVVIPRYGYNGAAVTTLLTETIGLAQMFYLLRRNISLAHTARMALKVAALAAAMGLLVWLTRERLPLAAVIALAAAAYGSAIIGLKIIPLAELTVILKKRGKGDGTDMQSPSSNP